MSRETCKIIQVDQEISREYFALATFTPSKTGDPIEDGHLSLDLTDGSEDYWHGEGLEGQGSAAASETWMHSALQALTPSTITTSKQTEYRWNTRGETNHLSMYVPVENTRTERVRMSLEKCADGRARLMTTLQKMIDTLTAMKHAKATLHQQVNILEEEAKEAQQLRTIYVEKKGESKERLYGALAELLNEATGFGHPPADHDHHGSHEQQQEEGALRSHSQLQGEGDTESNESSESESERESERESRESHEPISDDDREDY